MKTRGAIFFMILVSFLPFLALPSGSFAGTPEAKQAALSFIDKKRAAIAKKIYVPVQTSPEDLDLVAVGIVKDVIKPDTIKLENGKVVTLINIRVPLLYMPKAQEYLKEILVGKKVGVYQRNFPGVATTDRHENIIGQVLTEGNVWAQADLVLNGLAWADSAPHNRDMVQKLYQYEIIARTKRAGFWSAPELSVKNAKSILDNSTNSFQVFEDVVKSYKPVGEDLFYFNFGNDPTTDFTLVMDKKFGSYFADPVTGVFDPNSWKGRRIRVRGWITSNSGPMLEITHPEQIEFIGTEGTMDATHAPVKQSRPVQ